LLGLLQENAVKDTSMKIRYGETDKTDYGEFRYDEVQGPILVGRGDPFWLDHDAMLMPAPDDEYSIGPDTFEDWELIEASDAERRQLREAGFRIDLGSNAVRDHAGRRPRMEQCPQEPSRLNPCPGARVAVPRHRVQPRRSAGVTGWERSPSATGSASFLYAVAISSPAYP
jgi:hypothetical protein